MAYSFPESFDRNRAKELAALVNAAYDQQKASAAGVAWSPPAGYKLVASLSSKEYWKAGPMAGFFTHVLPVPPSVPFGFVATAGSAIYVIIRGTITPLEWFDDFSADPVSFRPNGQDWGQTTRGFGTLHADLGPQIINALQSLKASGNDLQTVFVAGHSLGSALARLAAAEIHARFNNLPVSYTYSGPRAGDPGFAAAFAASRMPVWRLFNTEDIVPTVPPAAVEFKTPNAGMHGLTAMTQSLSQFIRLGALGYQHVGYPVAITFHSDVVGDNHDMNRLVLEALQ